MILFQQCAHGRKGCVERRAEALNSRNNGDRDASRDEPVLDCCGGGIIRQKAQKAAHGIPLLVLLSPEILLGLVLPSDLTCIR